MGPLVAPVGLRHDARVPLFPRASLTTRLLKGLPQLREVTVTSLKRDVPFYAHLPAEVVDREIAVVTQRSFALFAKLLRDGKSGNSLELQDLLRSAARRAEEHAPLPDVLSAYYAGVRVGWAELRDLAEAGDVAEVVAIGDRVLHFLQVVTTAITEVYVETATALTGRERDARARLGAAILAGTESAEDFEDAGLEPWSDRTVVVLRRRQRRYADPTSAELAGRRRAREVRQALDAHSAQGAIYSFTATGAVILFHGRICPDQLTQALGPVIRGAWHAGLAYATDGAGTPAAFESAQSCADVAHRLRYPHGVYVMPQVLLEVQVTRPGPARQGLLDLVAGLECHEGLVETLEAHVEESGRRTDAARRLHIHPNTLDYRLRRIREVTGVDPADRDGAHLLRSALIARTYVAGGPARL